jgi:RNA polymerase sigma-70 factor (ECF subfamily)
MDARGDASTREAAEAVARRSYGKLIAWLAARTRDVASAEDALSEAFASAMTEWPQHGVPQNPEAWLLTVARRKMIDADRRRRSGEAASDFMRLVAEELEAAAASEAPVPDQRLLLMFACAHPAIDPGIRAPLILQTILGFDAATIASAFLVSPATMGQRLTRAKNKIRQAGIPFRTPEPEDLAERLEAVLEAIYAAFSEGWLDPTGEDARRRNLAGEAIWLARLVAVTLPSEPEALGLLALLLYSDARRLARRDATGDYVPLADQDPALWDLRAIEEAEALLLRASALGAPDRFQLEAAIQSAHVVRRRAGRADWPAIERLYEALLAMTGSPVVAVNRAVAVANARGPEAGLALLDAAAEGGRLVEYQSYWAARAELLARANDFAKARQAYQMAIGLESDAAVRVFLQRRLAALPGPITS